MLQPLLPPRPSITGLLADHSVPSQSRLCVCKGRLQPGQLALPLFHAHIRANDGAYFVTSITAITDPIIHKLAINEQARSKSGRVSVSYYEVVARGA